MAVYISQLYLALQRILPKRLVTSLVHRLAQIRTPAIKDFLIRSFLKCYAVGVDEIDRIVPGDFVSFNDFFTRELKAGCRPIDTSDASIISPADGYVSAIGTIETNTIYQAKGYDYSLEELLATDLDEARSYYDGAFATIYLAPFNYHRVHAPLAGELTAARFVPGTLFSVNPSTVSSLRGLFTRNERLICHFRSETGSYILIFVGALNVGSISTPWTGELRPGKGNVVDDIDLHTSSVSSTLAKGDLLGWFNMGSTVILLLPKTASEWRAELKSGDALKMGEAIGQIDT